MIEIMHFMSQEEKNTRIREGAPEPAPGGLKSVRGIQDRTKQLIIKEILAKLPQFTHDSEQSRSYPPSDDQKINEKNEKFYRTIDEGAKAVLRLMQQHDIGYDMLTGEQARELQRVASHVLSPKDNLTLLSIASADAAESQKTLDGELKEIYKLSLQYYKLRHQLQEVVESLKPKGLGKYIEFFRSKDDPLALQRKAILEKDINDLDDTFRKYEPTMSVDRVGLAISLRSSYLYNNGKDLLAKAKVMLGEFIRRSEDKDLTNEAARIIAELQEAGIGGKFDDADLYEDYANKSWHKTWEQFQRDFGREQKGQG